MANDTHLEMHNNNLMMNILNSLFRIDTIIGGSGSVLLFTVALSDVQLASAIIAALFGAAVSTVALLRGYKEYQITKLEYEQKRLQLEKELEKEFEQINTQTNGSSSNRQEEKEA